MFAVRAFWRRLLLAGAVVSLLLAPTARLAAQAVPPAQTLDSSRDLFGMVIRDPYYEFDTEPVQFPNASNVTALEREAAELEAMGVHWVRTEFWTDGDAFNWARYDTFINEIAPPLSPQSAGVAQRGHRGLRGRGSESGGHQRPA